MTANAQFNVVSNKRNHLYRAFLIRLRLLKCTRLSMLMCSQTITSTRCFLLSYAFRKRFTSKARYISKRELKRGPQLQIYVIKLSTNFNYNPDRFY